MSRNLFELLTTFSGNSYAFKDLIEEYQLDGRNEKIGNIFGNLYAIYQPAEARQAILYILHVYTVGSALILQGEPLQYGKQRAAEKVGLNEDMRNELVEFQYTYTAKPTKRKVSQDEVDEIEPDDATQEMVANEYNVEKIVTCIQAYFKYQDEPDATHLLFLKDLYDQARVTSHRMIKHGNNVDFDAKMKVMEHAEKLMKYIKDWEEKLAQKNANQKPLRVEAEEVKRKVFDRVRIENVV